MSMCVMLASPLIQGLFQTEDSAAEGHVFAIHPPSGQCYAMLHIWFGSLCVSSVSQSLTARCSHISLSWHQDRMALVPSLRFKLDTHDHGWLHSSAILPQLKHTPKEHLLFILHLHACVNSTGPSQRKFFTVFGFWLFMKQCEILAAD